MIKYRIHGRGGQGGVTLAKIIAFMYWTEGKWVQAFGNYSAERTGAPILAFTLIDDKEITNRSKVYYPDHLIIVDPTLLGDKILSGLQPNATLLIDTPRNPSSFDSYPGCKIAAVDAKKIAAKLKLGTKTTPITNTAIAGAFARVFGLSIESVEKTIKALHLPELNLKAAREAYDSVEIGEIVHGERIIIPVPAIEEDIPPLITGNLGSEPNLNVQDWKSKQPFNSLNNIPPCNFYCPAGNNIQSFINELSNGNYDAALKKLKETTPLPGSTARICPHPCEDFCNRQSLDGKVNIHGLERYAADHGAVNAVKTEITKDKKIAVIGSGPAGLSAAYHLRRGGYETSIFEAQAEPGGMLRAGIPDFRLPKNILEDEIKYIQDTGVEIKCNSPIESIDQFKMLTDEFDAVIIAIGLSFGREIGLEGESSGSIMQGIDFLKAINYGQSVEIGNDVIVIGGGNTAIDASRSAIRQGAKNVTIIYRRTREEMPAIPEEIDAALEENITLKYLHSPNKVTSRDGRNYLTVQKMELGEPDEDGRRRPIPVSGAFEDILFSSVLLATGQVANLEFLTEDIDCDNGFIKIDSHGRTSNSKVFASGDIATNDGTVTHAIGEGKKVADTVEACLGGFDVQKVEKNIDQMTIVEEMNLYYFKSSSRNNIREADIEKRVTTFEEVNLGIENVNEAIRCLSCGVCNRCGTSETAKCELFCPERIIERISATELRINYEGCKGCLICMEVCPRSGMDQMTVKKEDIA